MGYTTSHTLIVHVPQGDSSDVIDDLRNTSDSAKYAINDTGGTEEPCKWYQHEEDLRDFSKKYPDLLFELKGAGEDSGDIWVEYYKNGKMQRVEARIIFDPFNEHELV